MRTVLRRSVDARNGLFIEVDRRAHAFALLMVKTVIVNHREVNA